MSLGLSESVTLPMTERTHPAAHGLDALPPPDILNHLLTQQQAALAAVRLVFPDLEAAATMLAASLRAGRRIAYAGAGSSALMAMADGMELHGTYGVPHAQIILMMAGGFPFDARMPGDTEDDAAEGTRAADRLARGDTVVCLGLDALPACSCPCRPRERCRGYRYCE
jgi:N-acetylmuramic acid 6-phosphate etherase